MAGAVSQTAIYPLEITKTRLAVARPGSLSYHHFEFHVPGLKDCSVLQANIKELSIVYAQL